MAGTKSRTENSSSVLTGENFPSEKGLKPDGRELKRLRVKAAPS